MPLSKKKIEQIKKDAEAAYPTPTRKFNDGFKQQLDEQNRHDRGGYVCGASAEAEKAQILIVVLEDIKMIADSDGTYHDIIEVATAALQSYTNSK